MRQVCNPSNYKDVPFVLIWLVVVFPYHTTLWSGRSFYVFIVFSSFSYCCDTKSCDTKSCDTWWPAQLLLYVLDSTGQEGEDRSPAHDLKCLIDELREYNEELLDKPALVFANKYDLEGKWHQKFVVKRLFVFLVDLFYVCLWFSWFLVKDSYKKKLLSFASKMGLEVLTGRYVSGNSYNCSSFASFSGVLIISVYRYMRAYPILSYHIISILSVLSVDAGVGVPLLARRLRECLRNTRSVSARQILAAANQEEKRVGEEEEGEGEEEKASSSGGGKVRRGMDPRELAFDLGVGGREAGGEALQELVKAEALAASNDSTSSNTGSAAPSSSSSSSSGGRKRRPPPVIRRAKTT
jgi:hypothetical protein